MKILLLSSFVYLLTKRNTILVFLNQQLEVSLENFNDLVFYISFSLDRSYHELLLARFIYLIYQLLMSFISMLIFANLLKIEFKFIGFIFFLALAMVIINISSRLGENRRLLVKQIGDFLFYYELFLIQGENQLHALNKASKFIDAFPPAQNLEEHRDNFQKLFGFTKWLLVKRIAILIERGMHFSQEDLTMDFAQISDELFRKSYQDRKLQAEKLENMMLIPMIGDLMAMIVYIVSPFIGSLLGGK